MKTLPIAIAFGLFGALAVTVSFSKQPTYVMFIAWFSFYIFGKTWQSSLWVFLQIVLGMCMAVLIQLTAGLLSQLIGTFGFAASVFLYIGSLAYIARTRKLNNIPAWSKKSIPSNHSNHQPTKKHLKQLLFKFKIQKQ